MAPRTKQREYDPRNVKKGCKRCGSKTVAWAQSDSGKWYLTEIFVDADSRSYTAHHELHSPYCNDPHRKLDETLKRVKAEQAEREADEELRTQREEREAEENVNFFLSLLDLSADEKQAKLDELQREENAYVRNPPTMDYMTEWSREVSRAKRRKAEMEFLWAALNNSDDD